MATRHLLAKSMLGLAVLGGSDFSSPRRCATSRLSRTSFGRMICSTGRLRFPPAADPDGPLLSLRPPAALPLALFDQVFQRAMASFSSPAEPGIPLILRREFETVLAETLGPDELVRLARDVGLETVRLEPVCMAVYRTVEGREQQLFFVLFNLPQLARFRAEVFDLLVSRGRRREPVQRGCGDTGSPRGSVGGGTDSDRFRLVLTSRPTVRRRWRPGEFSATSRCLRGSGHSRSALGWQTRQDTSPHLLSVLEQL